MATKSGGRPGSRRMNIVPKGGVGEEVGRLASQWATSTIENCLQKRACRSSLSRPWSRSRTRALLVRLTSR